MKRLFFAVFSFLFVAAVSAQEIQFSGTLSSQAGIALPYTENSGDFLLGELKAQGEVSVYAQGCSLYANGFVLYDALKNRADALDFVSGDESTGIKMQEAWFDYTAEFWAFRIGRQISAWGKADGLCVADVLCPKDNTAFAARDYSESRLGIDAARLSLKNENCTFDAWWIPFFTPSALPLSDENPLKKTLFTTMQFSDDDISLPETNVKNGEYAIKASAYLASFDVSLYGFYGWEDEPTVSYVPIVENATPVGAHISGEYERMVMLAADAAIPAGETVLRFEGAFFPLRHFGTSAESQISALLLGAEAEKSVRRNQVKALAGIDWMPSSWTITAQYYADAIFGDIDALERPRYEHLATLSVSRSFFGETLTLSLDGILGLNDFDSAIQAGAEYSLSDHITLSVEADFFSKGKDGKTGMYGAYRDLSCIIFVGKFSF